jgi:tRNA pseudouridine55 synthase
LAGKDKRYTATLRLGQATTTYDAQGSVTAESTALPDRAAVEAALAEFRGPVRQVPPAFSAIKRDGQKAYELARRGEAVLLEPRPVTLHALSLAAWDPPHCVLEVHCSAGTYIRSLAHDLGQRLGCGAHLAALRRTASGALSVAQAVPLAALEAAFADGTWRRHLLPADAALGDWPVVHLSAEAVGRVLHGQAVAAAAATAPGLSAPADGTLARAYNPAGEFFAVLRADPAADVWRPEKVLADA